MATRLLGRRLAEKPSPAGAPPTRLVVRPELVRTMAAATFASDPYETGGPLIGTVARSWNGARFVSLVSLLGTILPAPGVNGLLASVSLGAGADGEREASALRWLRATTGIDLVHLGDWHAHPSGLCRPSAGDVRTAVAMRAKSAAPTWLTGISVGRPDGRDDVVSCGGAARYAQDRLDSAEVRFFEAVGQRLTALAVHVDSEGLPRLPPLPWHLADPARFAAECRLLAAAGFRTAIDASANGRPGVSLRVQREEGSPFTIDTGPAYPSMPPELRDERGRPIRLRTPHSPDRFLVDLVQEASR